MSLNSNFDKQLTDLSKFYQQEYLKAVTPEEKEKLIQGKWIHSNLTLSDKGIVGVLLNKWSVTRNFYRNKHGIDFEATLKKIKELADENLKKPKGERDGRVQDAEQLLQAYVTHIDIKNKSKELKLEYIRAYLNQIGEFYAQYEGMPPGRQAEFLEGAILQPSLKLSKPDKFTQFLNKWSITRGFVKNRQAAYIAQIIENLDRLDKSDLSEEMVKKIGITRNLLSAYVNKLELKPKNWKAQVQSQEGKKLVENAYNAEQKGPQSQPDSLTPPFSDAPLPPPLDLNQFPNLPPHIQSILQPANPVDKSTVQSDFEEPEQPLITRRRSSRKSLVEQQPQTLNSSSNIDRPGTYEFTANKRLDDLAIHETTTNKDKIFTHIVDGKRGNWAVTKDDQDRFILRINRGPQARLYAEVVSSMENLEKIIQGNQLKAEDFINPEVLRVSKVEKTAEKLRDVGGDVLQ